MLGAQGLESGRDIYRVTPSVSTVTQDLGFSGLISKTSHSIATYDKHRDVENIY
jgi:hypothetical protein